VIIGITKKQNSPDTYAPITPQGIRQLINNGHRVLIENNCGLNAGYHNGLYTSEGAIVLYSSKDIHTKSDIILSQRPSCCYYS
jgi:alanine dehydrogenase